MQELSTVLTSLSIAAGLACGVERTLEMLMYIMEFDDGTSKFSWIQFLTCLYRNLY